TQHTQSRSAQTIFAHTPVELHLINGGIHLDSVGARPDPPNTTPPTQRDHISQEATSFRGEPAIPNPIALKKDDWRYSVEAARITDKVRAENRYSFHGTPFSDVRPLKEITDPEVLRKMT